MKNIPLLKTHYVENTEGKTIKQMDLITCSTGEYMYIVFTDKTFTLIYSEGKNDLNTVGEHNFEEVMNDEFMIEAALEWIK